MRLILLTSLFFLSCAHDYTSGKNRMFQRAPIEQVYSSAGSEQYFLNELPDWFNVSNSGRCHKNYSVKYLDLSKLQNSFSMSYDKAVFIQYLYNVELQSYQSTTRASTFSLNDQDNHFQNILDRVQSGVQGFPLPSYKRVNLVWIDSYLKDGTTKLELQNLMKSEEMHLGHPVFVSLCLSATELEKLLDELKLANENIKFITYEALSIFTVNKTASFQLHLNLAPFFKKEQELHLYLNKQSRPTELLGDFIIHK